MIAKRRKIKKRIDWTKFFSSGLIVIFCLSIIVFLIVSNLKIRPQRIELQKKLDSLKKEWQILAERNQQLKAELEQDEKGIYWERKLREQGYVKPGEQAIVVYPAEEINKTEKKEAEQENNFWKNLIDWLRVKLIGLQ